MSSTHSSKGKYIVAALVGAAAGGLIVARSTKAIPKMMSGMMAKCEQMMTGMAQAHGRPADMCEQMMASQGNHPDHAAAHS